VNSKKKFVLTLLLIFMIMLEGCNYKGINISEKNNTSIKKITVYTNALGEQASVLQDIAQGFMNENPDIKVDFNSIGADYENILNIKVASDDLPDVWSTHGWAKERYGKYLEDLSSEKWADQIVDSLKPSVRDENGKVYCLPMDDDKAGPIYNKEILDRYNVKVPKTFDDFINACETIKQKSNGTITPVYIGADDDWAIGNFYDLMAVPLYLSPNPSYANDFKNGTFDWSKFNEISEKLLMMKDKGYLNKNILTTKYADMVQAFSSGKFAFAFVYGPYMTKEVLTRNPNLKIGIMPIPSVRKGDTPTFVGGERLTWGVNKNSKNKAEAIKFVDFYARPENIKKVAEADGMPAGLKGVQVDSGTLNEDYKSYSNIRIFPYFDREYLPNGMWDVICKNAQELLAGAITPEGFSLNMEREYKRLNNRSK
jgi:raffinose/stachyose/melibiose transport system substrate-binding protein